MSENDSENSERRVARMEEITEMEEIASKAEMIEIARFPPGKVGLTIIEHYFPTDNIFF